MKIGVNPDQFRQLSLKARKEAIDAEFTEAKKDFIAKLVEEGLLEEAQLQLDLDDGA